jgi:PIN domain nuclease of toxin-antitoxin system
VKFLLDTHLLSWAANNSPQLSQTARDVLNDPANTLYFSVASLWEMAIKLGKGRTDFKLDPRLLRRNMLDNGYVELLVGAEHVLATLGLPPLHNDPFDRLLLAQASVEGFTLLTSDKQLAAYAGPVRLI